MQGVNKNPNQHLLDVGCGLGGTAHYLDKHGWGKVSGIDVDEEVIQYARLHYPHVYFKNTDVLDVAKIFTAPKFDIIYSFNAFFCFSEQEKSLKAMAAVAKDNAELVIFDYSIPNDALTPIINPFIDSYAKSLSSKVFSPLNLTQIGKLLDRSGWQLKQIIDLSDKFEAWYQRLVAEMNEQRKELIQLFGEVIFNDLYDGYNRLLELIHEQKAGGAVVSAVRS
jgi:cyclopropane fatty-acyl-phospholipid synthase-like methyltransferase